MRRGVDYDLGVRQQHKQRNAKMTIKTRTVSSDPWKFAAVATDGDYSVQYIGDEGESRAIVKRKAARLLDRKI
jgi:hypothetical protein